MTEQLLTETYYYVGFAVTWIIVIIITVATVGFVGYSLYYLLYKKVWMNDWFAYNIRRVTIPTDKLRDGYAHFKMNAYWTRYTAKYRLRNIRKATLKQ